MAQVRRPPGPQVASEVIRPSFIDAPRTAGRDAALLSRGLAGVGDALAQISEREDSRAAYEQEALVKSAWAETEQQLRQKFRGANADGYMAELDSWWKDAAADGLQRLTPRARDLVGRSLGRAKQQAVSNATGYVAEEKGRAQLEAFKASKVAERQRALTDMRPEALLAARDLLRERNATQAAQMGWSPEQLENENLGDLSELHVGALYKLIDRDAEAAGQYFQTHQAEIDSRLQPQIERAIEGGSRLARSQSVADTIMGRGLPLDEAMRTVEREFSGEDERAIKAELQSRYSYADKARQENQERFYGTAQLEVEQTGRVKPSTFALLTDSHRAAILNRVQAEARRRSAEAHDKPVRTDWKLYLSLREEQAADPDAFAKRDLAGYVDRLAGPQLEQLADLVTSAAKPKSSKAPRDTATLTQQVNAAMASAGVKSAERKGKFLAHVQGEVDALAQKLDRPPTFEERQPIIDRALLQGNDPDTWSITPSFLASKRRLFELTPEQRERFQPFEDQPSAPVRVRDEAHYQSLPPGTRFVTPDGKTGTKR